MMQSVESWWAGIAAEGAGLVGLWLALLVVLWRGTPEGLRLVRKLAGA